MKILLFNLIFLFMYNNIPLELLGKHISEIPEASRHTSDTNNGGIYTIDTLDQFLGKPYSIILITTNKDGIIQNFRIYIDEIIDQSFFDKMIERYGDPNKMYKKGKAISKDKEIIHKDGFAVQSTESTLEECSFNDSPLFIVWKKENFDIEVIRGHESDTFQKTSITFGKGFTSKFIENSND